VRNVIVVDPTSDPKAFEELVRSALDKPELSVIIARRNCCSPQNPFASMRV